MNGGGPRPEKQTPGTRESAILRMHHHQAIGSSAMFVRIFNWPLLAARGDFDQSYLQLLEQVRAA